MTPDELTHWQAYDMIRPAPDPALVGQVAALIGGLGR